MEAKPEEKPELRPSPTPDPETPPKEVSYSDAYSNYEKYNPRGDYKYRMLRPYVVGETEEDGIQIDFKDQTPREGGGIQKFLSSDDNTWKLIYMTPDEFNLGYDKVSQ